MARLRAIPGVSVARIGILIVLQFGHVRFLQFAPLAAWVGLLGYVGEGQAIHAGLRLFGWFGFGRLPSGIIGNLFLTMGVVDTPAVFRSVKVTRDSP